MWVHENLNGVIMWFTKLIFKILLPIVCHVICIHLLTNISNVTGNLVGWTFLTLSCKNYWMELDDIWYTEVGDCITTKNIANQLDIGQFVTNIPTLAVIRHNIGAIYIWMYKGDTVSIIFYIHLQYWSLSLLFYLCTIVILTHRCV